MRPLEVGAGAGVAVTVASTYIVVGGLRGCIPCKVAVVSRSAAIASIAWSACWGRSGGSRVFTSIGSADVAFNRSLIVWMFWFTNVPKS